MPTRRFYASDVSSPSGERALMVDTVYPDGRIQTDTIGTVSADEIDDIVRALNESEAAKPSSSSPAR
ncbi:MAG: hypothetical protein PVSMB8_15630 [Vulcanimicrobiaceae bacterium]